MPPRGVARFDWPRWTCTAIDAATGWLCGMRATWKEHPTTSSYLWWLRCDRHHGPAAALLLPDEPFVVTRLEVRVAIASLGPDRRLAADEAVRQVTQAIGDAGGVVVGLKVPGRRSTDAATRAALGRLELAGPPEGDQRADRPFWGALDEPERLSWWRRRKVE